MEKAIMYLFASLIGTCLLIIGLLAITDVRIKEALERLDNLEHICYEVREYSR